jgi:hypothetical protein
LALTLAFTFALGAPAAMAAPQPSHPAATPPPPPWTPPETAAPPPAVDAAAAADPTSVQREALFDIAFKALATGNLVLAEQAFTQAAALPGDAAFRSVALSFAERVRRARAMRAATPPSVKPGAIRQSDASTPPRRDFSGRVPLLLTTTALGLGAYGWALPAMFGVNFNETPRTFVGLYMLAASSAFVIPYASTRGTAVSAGQANLAFYGGTRGLYLGVLTAALFEGNVSPNIRYGAFASGVLVGSVSGLWAGHTFAEHHQLTAGQARTMAVMGDFGLGLGFGSGFLLDFDGIDKTQDERARRMGSVGLLGAAVGLTSGYILARRRDNSWGDGEVLRMVGLLGAWSGFTLADVADAGKKPAIATVMVGGLLGLGAGDRLVVHTDFSVGQSLLVDLASVAGALAAAGTLYLFSPQDWSEKPFVLASALGAIGGFGLSYWALQGRAEDGATAALTRTFAAGSVSLIPLCGVRGERGLTLIAAF